ncbi:hypothetical protein HPB49_008713 [Dermacentor silvarum]|uniref:Uncharacterized protein n=1 Tax=Dermacentor silvarum TaxID=543639 RepID=A0ACB8DBY5_DERSI|nr:hypothetical protein HPB49_008713 [Dermacentor silvarum]
MRRSVAATCVKLNRVAARQMRAYKQHIRRAKDAADRALCQDMTARNLYGSPFKLAFEKLHSATLLPPLETSPNVVTSSVLASATLLLSEHVATDDPSCDTPFHARLRALACSDYPPVPDDHAFTLPEIEHALFQGNLRSAPGLDGLTGIHRCPANLYHLFCSFLSGRRVVFRARAGEVSASPTIGSPQGSPISPLLWNLIVHSLLSLPMPDGPSEHTNSLGAEVRLRSGKKI